MGEVRFEGGTHPSTQEGTVSLGIIDRVNAKKLTGLIFSNDLDPFYCVRYRVIWKDSSAASRSK